jgi:epoxyqueuosine reductase
VAEKADDFGLSLLLHMDKEYFETKVWPHMFYMSYDDVWRWKMNVARAMGNSRDEKYIADLIRAFDENEDEKVKGMCAWALGHIGGDKAMTVLRKFKQKSEGVVFEEITHALQESVKKI